MAEHSTCSVRSVQLSLQKKGTKLSVGSVHKLMKADKKPHYTTKVARLKDTSKEIRKLWVKRTLARLAMSDAAKAAAADGMELQDQEKAKVWCTITFPKR